MSQDYLAQYEQLRAQMPRAALNIIEHQNSNYCNYIDKVKDCYLITSAMESEGCMYGRNLFFNLHCIDCIDVHNSELCYECVSCKNCYNCNHCQDCSQCVDSEYLKECKSCTNCFGCINLKHAKYHIFNQAYSLEEYAAKIAELKAAPPGHIQQEFQKLKELSPHISTHGHSNEKSTGDYIFNTQNCHDCYESKESRDCLYSIELLKCEDCVDTHISEFGKWNYDCVSAYKLHNSNFCYNCWESSDLEYCEICFQCEHCLFCVFQKHKRYRILNRQYEPEEYHRLKAQILAEMKATGQYTKHLPSTYPLEDSIVGDYS